MGAGGSGGSFDHLERRLPVNSPFSVLCLVPVLCHAGGLGVLRTSPQLSPGTDLSARGSRVRPCSPVTLCPLYLLLLSPGPFVSFPLNPPSKSLVYCALFQSGFTLPSGNAPFYSLCPCGIMHVLCCFVLFSVTTTSAQQGREPNFTSLYKVLGDYLCEQTCPFQTVLRRPPLLTTTQKLT